MPLYSFNCPDCGEDFEKVVVRMANEPTAACPSCGVASTKRGFDLPARTVGRDTVVTRAACQPGEGPCGTIGCRRGK